MLTRTDASSNLNALYDIIEAVNPAENEMYSPPSPEYMRLTFWTRSQARAASIRQAIAIPKLAVWDRKIDSGTHVIYTVTTEAKIKVTIYCTALPPSCRIETEEYTEDEPEMAATGRIIAVKKTRTKVICD